MKFSKFLLSVLTISSSTVFAGEGGRGGDPVALEFTQEVQVALFFLRENPELFPEITNAPFLSKILSEAQIYVVDHPCIVERNQIKQNATVCNEPAKQTVSIYRSGWNSEFDECIKRGTGLHEVLSLGQIENTGDYHLSQKFVAACKASDHSRERDIIVTSLSNYAHDKAPYLALASASTQPSGQWISGAAVLDQIKERLNTFRETAAGFRELPYNYQLDMIVTGSAAFTPFKMNRGNTLFTSSELGSFYPMTQWLASDLNVYITHIASVLSLYKKKSYTTLSFAGKKKLDDLIKRSQSLVAVVDHLSHDGGEFYQNLHYVVPTNPYSDYFTGIVGKMRKYVVQNKCLVPSTFKNIFYTKLAEDNLKNNLSAGEFESEIEHFRAERAGQDFQKSLSLLTDEWLLLSKSERLDRITFDTYIPLGSKNVAAGLAWTMTSAIEISRVTTEQFKEDSKILSEISKKLEAGLLCIK